MIGQILGHCRVIAKIGEGGMGVVYRAYDEVLHRDVAVKVVKKDAGIDSSGRQNLLQEARASSSLGHPNICTIYEVGESDGDLYIVMELVEGKSLHTMSAGVGVPPESVLRYGIQIASALCRAHDRGIVHRDLKTSNVVVTSDGLVKVLDFGLAKRVGGGVLDAPTMSFSTVHGASSVSGTLPYMAPEILRGDASDARSDLWALGVVLYELASGRLPFEGRTGFEISSSIMREIPKPLGPPVPPGLWAVIQKCLAKEPLQRYQRAAEVQAALEAVQSGAIVKPTSGADQTPGPRVATMHSVRHVRVKKGDFLLLAGTLKGLFIFRSNAQRTRWELSGPYFHGLPVYAIAYDNRRGLRRIWAATASFWGPLLRSSDDFGKMWTNPQESPVRFPAETGTSLKNIWQITPGPADEPNLLYCGVEPAALFETHDAGETWSLVRGLFDHPHRPRWLPGNGGLALHSILLDPSNKQRIYVAISSGGVYRTEDAGVTWTAQNRGIRATFMPDKYPEFGQCVHKIALHPKRPERLFLQNHWGLYRSDNYADSWTDIANNVPSDFGFPVVMHPHNPDCAYIVPVESDEFRCSCDGRLRVYRTRSAGNSWEPLMRGLPQKEAYETVLRDGLTVDSYDPAGIYLGTRSGQLFGSHDEGKTWQKIHDGLPSIVCLRTAIVEDGSIMPVKVPKDSRSTQASKPRAGSNSATRRNAKSNTRKR
ncbi:MAG TPA: protein kinase [Candidatus Sulfotelmatobacter sp.]|nr:protein kinase [Candidatus Sulfotelmatobacter sp.]